MKKTLLLVMALSIASFVIAQNRHTTGIYQAKVRPVGASLNLINETPSFNGPTKILSTADNSSSLLKVTFGSSANPNGIFNYDERFLTISPSANMFNFGNRAGGAYGNTGNDLKFTFTTDQGANWDSCVVTATSGHNFRYPSMVTYNPNNSTNPHDMYGVFTGPITNGSSWIENFYGSIKLDGTNKDVNFKTNASGIYLNHMDICLYCSPDGHATVASNLLLGTTGSYTQNGFQILNGAFNSATSKFDWAPIDSLKPDVLEDGRTDAAAIAWSPDGSVGYFVFTAIDADANYNPYGVEWPIVYKSTDHGATWEKAPAFDYSTINVFKSYLFPTRMDTSLVIPRWFNKWADTRNESTNGAVVDKFGNLHIFGYVRGTISINPDSLNYFYSAEPVQLFDVYMTRYGSWNAYYIDTLKSTDTEAGSFGLAFDHQMQMTRTPDGSKVFCVWTDTDPFFAADNSAPDIKAIGYDAENFLITPVKNFTQGTEYMADNFYMRVATDAFYDGTAAASTLPVTTDVLGSTSSDPILFQYVTGLTFNDSDFGTYVGTPNHNAETAYSPVSANFPNPFKGKTQVNINLQKATSVNVSVSSILGQQVSNVNYGVMSQGMHTLTINANDLNSGVYFYTVTMDGKSYTHKMIVK
ncbi:MAG: T9SS type A sorting domain-containing protein [Bacteroidota bacterium]|nr:T9SS type A sorting domain-containing protein [Bacteroidota bacterium]